MRNEIPLDCRVYYVFYIVNIKSCILNLFYCQRKKNSGSINCFNESLFGFFFVFFCGLFMYCVGIAQQNLDCCVKVSKPKIFLNIYCSLPVIGWLHLILFQAKKISCNYRKILVLSTYNFITLALFTVIMAADGCHNLSMFLYSRRSFFQIKVVPAADSP